MIPLKDDIPTDRLPLVTLLAVGACALVALLVRDAGVAAPLLAALALWLFGPSVEDAGSRPRFALLLALGAGVGVALGALATDDAPVAASAVAGAAACSAAAHLRLYPRARIVGIVPIPFAVTLAAPPAWTLALAWVALQVVLAVTAVAGPLGDGGAAVLLATAGGALVGLLASAPLARRRKRHPAPLANPLPAP